MRCVPVRPFVVPVGPPSSSLLFRACLSKYHQKSSSSSAPSHSSTRPNPNQVCSSLYRAPETQYTPQDQQTIDRDPAKSRLPNTGYTVLGLFPPSILILETWPTKRIVFTRILVQRTLEILNRLRSFPVERRSDILDSTVS